MLDNFYFVVHTRDGGDYNFDKKAQHVDTYRSNNNLIVVKVSEFSDILGIFPINNVSWVECVYEEA